MTMLAEVVDAVIGIDTHRDSHEVEIADPAGKPIALLRIGNDSAGFAQLLAAIAKMVPGPRVAVCIEGSRSYGIGLARALAAAGLLVIECEQPVRRHRRGKGRSDPIDAHLLNPYSTSSGTARTSGAAVMDRREAVVGLPCSRLPGRARGGMRGALSGAVMASLPMGRGPGRPAGLLEAGLRGQPTCVFE